MSAFAHLEREFAAWSDAGLTASLWWRDDDATEPTAPLARLVKIAGSHGAPLSLAVIPEAAKPGLRPLLEDCPRVSAMVHGFAHANHAPPSAKKSEFGLNRPLGVMLAEAGLGWTRLQALVPHAAIPVFAPPWNRIAPEVVSELPRLGYGALSAFGPRAASPRIATLNAHADLCDWRRGGRFVGAERAAGAIVGHLERRRGAFLGAIPDADFDPTEPTGVLTHHARMDADAFAFLDALLSLIAASGAARFLSAREILSL